MNGPTVVAQYHELLAMVPEDPSDRTGTYRTRAVTTYISSMKERGELIHLIVDRNKQPHFGKTNVPGVALAIQMLVDKLTVIEIDGTKTVHKDRWEQIKPIDNEAEDARLNQVLRDRGMKLPGDA